MDAAVQPAARRRGHTVGRILSLSLLLVIALAVLLFGAVQWLDTDNGRAFVLRQLPLYAPQSGLTVRAGRIDGSIFGAAVIHDLEVGDPKGVFVKVPRLDLDWRPLDLVRNTLSVKSAHAAEVRMLRKPALRPSADKRILPDIDIVIGTLKIDRLILDPPVSGVMRTIGVGGSADIRQGRARIVLNAVTLGGGGGDSVRLKLDSEPDRDTFDVDADVMAPRGGALTTMLGLQAPLAVTVKGDGSWTIWRGQVLAQLDRQPLAHLRLTAEKGRFGIDGTARPALLLTGAAARLTGPVLDVRGTATLTERIAAINLDLASPALTVNVRGGLDFGNEVFQGIRIAGRLRDPAALHPRISGRDVQLAAQVAGTFKYPLVDYRLSAANAAWGHTGATNLVAAGIVRAGVRPLVIPLDATASTVSGVGEVAGALLHNVRINGPLTLAGGRLVSRSLSFRSDRLRGTGTASIVLGGGDFVIGLKGALPQYLVPGLGLADITADVRAVPGPEGARVTGTTVARVTRLDNGFFRTLLEGLPVVTADIDVIGDTSLTFRNARLVSPGLTLLAQGTRAADGFVRMTGQGVSRQYGPVQLTLAGQIEAPAVDLVLARPGLGLGLAQVSGHVAPVYGGWSFDAHGGSDYGPAAARGLIRTGSGPLTIDIASLAIAGQTGRGSVVETAAGPFAGRIGFGGKGLDGEIVLAAAGALQRADVTLKAVSAVLPGAVPVTIGQGLLQATVTLPPSGSTAGPSVTGRFAAERIERNGLRIAKTQGRINYQAGRGGAMFTANGETSVPFSVTGDVAFAPDRIELRANGTLDSKPIALAQAAVLTRGADGWRLAPVTLQTAAGQADFSGQFGKTNALKAQLRGIGLSLLGGFVPGLDVAGRVSGQIDMVLPAGGLPAGTANLRLNGLTRAGIAAASTPIDVGLNARFGNDGGEARAVIVRGGVVEGRIQARVGPVPGSNADPVLQRLLASPLFAQARYSGPAQALWGLAGISAIDMRGPVTIAADAGGKLGEPTLSGTITAKGARVENPTLGTVVDNAALDARFTASRLELTHFSGTVGKGGTIAGSGTIGLSADAGFPVDISADVVNAQLIKRDDMQATATGKVRLATDAYGGVVSGKLTIDKATYRLGRASAADVAVLDVTERNTALLGRRAIAYVKPTRWLLNIDAKADRRLFVSGMGLEAEWRGAVTIKGPTTAPEIFGRVQIVRGDYEFAGKRFSLSRGDIRFAGGYPPDPLIDILAENSGNALTAQLTINGTALKPQIKFSSVPSLPEDEVLSRVLFGDSVTNLSAPEALQLAAALNGLRGGNGFNPVNSVRKGLGIDRLRILSADPLTGRKTTVAAGQYIGRSVYVELATDASGYTATNLELTLTRSLSILSQVATLGGTSVSLKWKKDY